MGDEIREPRKVLPGAIFWGGVISGAVYVGATCSMLIAMPHEQIGVLSGVLQTINSMAQRVDLHLVVAPLALFEALAILGTASAWFSGTARLPFVAGIDHYLPSVLGRVHPRFHTPYVALTVFAILSALLILMSYMGASVSEAYLTLLSISVVLQLIPNVYMFAALIRLAWRQQAKSKGRLYSAANGLAGLLSSTAGICMAFVPAETTGHVWTYEFKLVFAIGTVLGVALLLYARARHRKRRSVEGRRATEMGGMG
jgi:amino acid transporter